MANIQQQKRRIRRSKVQRERNLNYRSSIKTLFRRVSAAAEAGDAEELATRARELERLLDRSAARGVIHRNSAARKKRRLSQIQAGAA